MQWLYQIGTTNQMNKVFGDEIIKYNLWFVKSMLQNIAACRNLFWFFQDFPNYKQIKYTFQHKMQKRNNVAPFKNVFQLERIFFNWSSSNIYNSKARNAVLRTQRVIFQLLILRDRDHWPQLSEKAGCDMAAVSFNPF